MHRKLGLIVVCPLKLRDSESKVAAANTRAEILQKEIVALKDDWERKKAFLLQ